MSTVRQTFTAVADRSDGDTRTLMLAYAKIAGDLPMGEQDLAVACEAIAGAYIGVLSASDSMRFSVRCKVKSRAKALRLLATADSFVVLGDARAEALDRAHTVWHALADATRDSLLALERDILEMAFDMEG